MAFLELNGVVKRFGRNTVVRRLSLDVEEGEFVSFLGGSGCGKTTTLRMIAGFETPTEGQHPHRRGRRGPACRPTAATSAWYSRTTRSSRT